MVLTPFCHARTRPKEELRSRQNSVSNIHERKNRHEKSLTCATLESTRIHHWIVFYRGLHHWCFSDLGDHVKKKLNFQNAWNRVTYPVLSCTEGTFLVPPWMTEQCKRHFLLNYNRLAFFTWCIWKTKKSCFMKARQFLSMSSVESMPGKKSVNIFPEHFSFCLLHCFVSGRLPIC